jgi:hypothetical protein
MLYAGSGDGVYRVPADGTFDDDQVEHVLDSERVMRLERFDALDGLFAATAGGLYHSPDGDVWRDLAVPEPGVYSVGATPDGSRLYAGTRPAAIYVAEVDGELADGGLDWRELDAFQDLPSRDDWQLPRHENLAQVRDVHALGGGRLVAGVEVGGVHVSEDSGRSWAERRDGVDDDVHELHVVDSETWVAACGFGAFRTTDAGESWTRLDEGFEQGYCRSAFSFEGDLYVGAATSSSGNWNEPDEEPAFYVSRDGGAFERVAYPTPDEVVTGMTSVDGSVFAGTHRGHIMRRSADGWTVVGSVPTPGRVGGRYTPLAAF